MKHKIITIILLAPMFAGMVNATHDPNDFFVLEASFPGVIFEDIHGASASAVWAVGSQGLEPRIIKRGVSSWAVQSHDTTGLNNFNRPFRAVWAITDSDVWAAGRGDTAPGGAAQLIQHYNGASWSQTINGLGLSDRDVASLWAFSSTDVWAATNDDANDFGMIHWTGSSWAECSTCNFMVDSVYGIAANDIWAVARMNGERYRHYNGLNWVASLDVAPVLIDDIWGTAPNDFWAVSGGAGLFHYDGTAWLPSASPALTLNSIWGTSASDIWAVGNTGTIIHYDGTTWTSEPSPSTENLKGVWCLNASNCWIVGENGGIYKLQVNPPVTLPVLTGLQWDPSDMIVHADDACLGDEVELTINLEPSLGAGGIVWYVIDSDTNIVIESGTAAQFFNLQNKHFYTSRTYPTGEYTFLATADVTGLLTLDNWAAQGFNVDTGTCFTATEAQTIQNRFNNIDTSLSYMNATLGRLDTNLSHVHTEIHGRTSYISNQINETKQLVVDRTTYINFQNNESFTVTWALQNSIHSHIDSHFQYQNQLFNDTFAELNFNITFGNITLGVLSNLFNESFTTQSVPIAQSIDNMAIVFFGFLLLIGLIIWAEWSKEWLIYLLAVVVAGVLTIGLWSELGNLRFAISGIAILLILRTYVTFKGHQESLN